MLPLLGCGPVQYFGQVSSSAATALAQAEGESAAQLAPYEYTKARAYYQQSRVEAGRSAFENAIEYGRRAEALALRAKVVARERALRSSAAGPPTGATAPPEAPSLPEGRPSAPSLPEAPARPQAPSLPERRPARGDKP